MPSLRLLSVNAHTLPVDRAGLAQLIADAAPDVACVHGSPSLLRWRSRSAALARKSGLVVVSGGRAGGANLILSTLGVDVSGTRDLRFADSSGVAPAGATLAALAHDGSPFVLVAARLLGNAAQRLAQATELRRALARFVPGEPPTIIAAEGADRPGTAAWSVLADGRTALAGGVFVDARIDAGTAPRADVLTALAPQVDVALNLPAAAPIG